MDDLGTFDGDRLGGLPRLRGRRGPGRGGGQADLGICTCGTGIGISMAANKVAGIRAAVVHDVTTATLARQHNHANVLCLGSRTTGPSRGRRCGAWPSCPPPRNTGGTTGESPSWPNSTGTRTPSRLHPQN